MRGSITTSAKLIALALMAAISALIACAPKPKPEVVPPVLIAELPVPRDLRAEAENGRAILDWSVDRQDGVLISGYNVYLADSEGMDNAAWADTPGTPYNGFPYPGDTDGDPSRESMPLPDLVNGQRYLAMVRTVGPDGRLSASSNVVSFMPLARGEFVISSNQASSDGGFNFEQSVRLPGRDPKNDLYLYSTETKIGLSSPNRLVPGLRKTRFGPSGNGSVSEETIRISKGESFSVKTRTGRAEIRIVEIMGKYPEISARISFTYYPDGAEKR